MRTTLKAPALLRLDAARTCRIRDAEKRGREMTNDEAAAFLNVNPQTLRNWTCRRETPVYKYMGRVRFFENELKNYKQSLEIAIR